MFKKLALFIEKNQVKILWLAMAGYFLIFTAISFFKYFDFAYNGLDLAIYNQVFWNSVHGDLFGFTIHPQSYLGDHFELFIIALLPFYYLFQSPLALLILQALALALPAWPLYLIAKKYLSGIWPLGVALFWLLNPLAQNANVFEFHILPFALFFLFFAVYFYLKKKFKLFLVFCLMSLLVREDVSLVILMFTPLALFEKRSLKWILWPMVLGLGWFYLAIKAIDYFTPAGTYKFAYYYGWLGNNLPEMARNFFLRPLSSLRRVFTLNNIVFALALFVPAGFINLIQPKYLLLALPAFAQIILGGSGNSVVALKIHYTSLILPGLFLALIFGLKKITETDEKNSFLAKYRQIILLILTAGAIYGFWTMGPAIGSLKKIITYSGRGQIREIKNEFLNYAEPTDKILASYEFLTKASSRAYIYALHYVFQGKKQFSDLDYNLPEDVNVLLIDHDDFLKYDLTANLDDVGPIDYNTGDNRVRDLLEKKNFSAEKLVDTLVFYGQNSGNAVKLYELNPSGRPKNRHNVKLGAELEFLGSSDWDYPDQDLFEKYNLLPVSLYFSALKTPQYNYNFKIIVKDEAGGIIHEKSYPLAYGLYPTKEWKPGEIIKINYAFLLPEKINFADKKNSLWLEIEAGKGYITLDGWGQAQPKSIISKKLTPIIEITF